MTPEFWAIIGVGVAIAGIGTTMALLGARGLSRLDNRLDRLDEHVRSQGERLASLEGKVDTLIATAGQPRPETLVVPSVRRGY